MDPKCFLVAWFFHLNPNLGSSSLVDDVVRFGLRWNGLLGYEFLWVSDFNDFKLELSLVRVSD